MSERERVGRPEPRVVVAPVVSSARRNLERTRRAAQLQSVIDRILDASKPNDLQPTGHYALDATGLWAWARPGSQSKGGEQHDE